jgi:predicted neuraminidase
MLFYKVGVDARHWWGMLTVSGDDGRSWSSPRRLGEHPLIGPLVGPAKNKPLELADGSIICPCSTEVESPAGDGRHRWRIHFEVSSDGGNSWEIVRPEGAGGGLNAIQPALLIHPEGGLQALCRCREGLIAESRSADGGRTWSEVTATDLPNPNSGIDAVTLRDGRHLLVYNHSGPELPGPNRRRSVLNVALSGDGRSWTPVLTLEDERQSPPEDMRSGSWDEFSYPAVIQASDGSVHVTYSWRRLSVKHVVLDPEALARSTPERPAGE